MARPRVRSLEDRLQYDFISVEDACILTGLCERSIKNMTKKIPEFGKTFRGITIIDKNELYKYWKTAKPVEVPVEVNDENYTISFPKARQRMRTETVPVSDITMTITRKSNSPSGKQLRIGFTAKGREILGDNRRLCKTIKDGKIFIGAGTEKSMSGIKHLKIQKMASGNLIVQDSLSEDELIAWDSVLTSNHFDMQFIGGTEFPIYRLVPIKDTSNSNEDRKHG